MLQGKPAVTLIDGDRKQEVREELIIAVIKGELEGIQALTKLVGRGSN